MCVYIYIHTYVYLTCFVSRFPPTFGKRQMTFAMRPFVSGFLNSAQTLHRYIQYVCTYIYIYTYICICVNVYIHIHVHIHKHIYIYIYMLMYEYIYIYIHMRPVNAVRPVSGVAGACVGRNYESSSARRTLVRGFGEPLRPRRRAACSSSSARRSGRGCPSTCRYARRCRRSAPAPSAGPGQTPAPIYLSIYLSIYLNI